jgi:hypothetical protein
MSSAKRATVPRPLKAGEYSIAFVTREAAKGWQDLLATARNAATDAWDFLTKTPTEEGRACYRLHGDQAVVRVDGKPLQRWQYKPTKGGRIWYAVVTAGKGAAGSVLIERVFTGHPNETVKQFR